MSAVSEFDSYIDSLRVVNYMMQNCIVWIIRDKIKLLLVKF